MLNRKVVLEVPLPVAAAVREAAAVGQTRASCVSLLGGCV
jgi:hypothetical protein